MKVIGAVGSFEGDDKRPYINGLDLAWKCPLCGMENSDPITYEGLLGNYAPLDGTDIEVELWCDTDDCHLPGKGKRGPHEHSGTATIRVNLAVTASVLVDGKWSEGETPP